MSQVIRPKFIFILILFIYLLSFLSHSQYLKKTIYGDGIYYFSWLHTLAVDHNLSFANEFKFYHQNRIDPTKNLYSIGPAILWGIYYLPSYISLGGNGFEFTYEVIIGLSGVLYSIAGLILLYRILLTEYKENIALITILFIAFTTNLFFYGSVDTVNSHALTFFAAVTTLNFIYQKNNRNFFLIGCFLGIQGLIRMQDLIYIIYLIKSKFIKFNNILYVFTGFILVLSPQLFIWKIIYNSYTTSPYFAEKALYFIPFSPKIGEILFHPKNGLFLLTPITLISVGGLIYMIYKKRNYNYIYHLVIFIIQLYVVSIRNEWWQEASFSGRMFVSIIPQFSFGLASLLKNLNLRKNIDYYKIIIALLLFTILNISLIIYYLYTH